MDTVGKDPSLLPLKCATFSQHPKASEIKIKLLLGLSALFKSWVIEPKGFKLQQEKCNILLLLLLVYWTGNSARGRFLNF
jgi:hypothetical protein